MRAGGGPCARALNRVLAQALSITASLFVRLTLHFLSSAACLTTLSAQLSKTNNEGLLNTKFMGGAEIGRSPNGHVAHVCQCV